MATPRIKYHRDERVEICSEEEGFFGSYYEATIVSHLRDDLYVVRYERLFESDHSAEPLVETVRRRELRPAPPPPPPTAEFAPLDLVDAFDNDGWWIGRVVAKLERSSDRCCYYSVLFEYSGNVVIDYPVSCLRPHLDWVRAKWVSQARRRAMVVV